MEITTAAALVSHMRLLRDAEPGEIATPPMFGAFACLHVNGRDLRALPLRARRVILLVPPIPPAKRRLFAEAANGRLTR